MHVLKRLLTPLSRGVHRQTADIRFAQKQSLTLERALPSLRSDRLKNECPDTENSVDGWATRFVVGEICEVPESC